ncbi:hypothetical protein [Rhizobium sp. BR 362]|uniref:hypothetical protein n=1 Tax=Rhizobium sp. BR 362 TaxID=3040670 RepID=UPI002F42B903
MNKIVIEHYPASKLPEDLREKLEKDAKTVRLVMESESAMESGLPEGKEDKWPGFKGLMPPNPEPMSVDELLATIERLRAENRPSVTREEAVARIRALRDEWDY